jgi:serine/threonine-protein kinase
MVADLEEVLAIEASRLGQATGEATSVLRTLPGTARRRLPWRMRHPARWAASLGLLAVAAAIALVAAAGQTHRGTGVAPGVHAQAGLQPVPLSQTAAQDYNPFGTGPENRDLVQNVVDSDPNTSWSTEQYYDGTLRKPGGVGAGLYLDASPGVVARAIEIQTPTPGFAAQIYAADGPPPTLPYGDRTPLAARGWQGPLGTSAYVHSHERIRLAGERRFRFYLIWISALPANMQSAAISEVVLFR